jgi:hypothetical protein
MIEVDSSQTKRKKLLPELRWQRLDLPAPFLIPRVQ